MAISSAEFHTNSTRIPRTELRTNSLRLVTCGGHGSIENTALRYHGPLSGQSKQGCDVDPRVVSVIAQRLPRVKPRAVVPRSCGAWPVCRCRAAPPWILSRGCRLRPRQQQLQHSVLGAGKPHG